MKTFFSVVYAALALPFALAMALPTQLQTRYDWVPPVTYPVAGTVWEIGSSQNVTWDTAYKPYYINTDPGELFLMYGADESGDLELASGFDLVIGWVVITVPDVTPGDDYQLVLFGDSGNFSPAFSIVAAA